MRWGRALAELGLHGEALDRAMDRVLSAVDRTLADHKTGRWLLDSSHGESACELALTRVDSRGAVGDIVIDRTFIDRDSGERWIVDYKTSAPAPGESVARFFEREAQHYREQLEGYRDCMALRGSEPVRCALYFTSLAQMHELTELATP